MADSVGRAREDHRQNGGAGDEIQAVCNQRTLPLHVFPWRPEIGRAGLRRNAVYLVRPDSHVALADPAGSASAIASYLDARKLTLAKRELRSRA